MLNLIKEAIKETEAESNHYFTNINSVDDIPTENKKG